MQESILQTLATLVAFDTTSRSSNLELIAWISDYLSSLGVSSRLTYNEERSKANLYAQIGPQDLPVMILSGHSDVVPVDGQPWASDPFVLVSHDGRHYGRGAADMKGFIACVLHWLPEVLARHAEGRLAQPIGIALSYDEEVGCLGVPGLIRDLLDRGVQVAGCIVGEPTGMMPVVAHKGIAHFKCLVRGRAVHSSLTPRGVNAIEYAARLIGHIRKLADAEAQFGHQQPLYDVSHATLQTGTIHGGTVANIVPRECEFIFECRWLPGDQLERFLDSIHDYAQHLRLEMQAIAPESDIVFEQLIGCQPFESHAESVLMDYVNALSPGAVAQAVAYTTEAGCFSAAGFPCVVLGPGSIAQAHKPNEYIEEGQLRACSDWLARLLSVLCTSDAEVG